MRLRPLVLILASFVMGCGSQHARAGDDARSPAADAAHHPDAPRAAIDAAHHDARVPDAAPADAGHLPDAAPPPADAAAPPADAASPVDAGTAAGVTVACYSEGSPGATCTSPDHCCFSDYSAYHDGLCTTSSCTWGTIDCDGPEDCAAGQHCCSHAMYSPDLGVTGYLIACQAAACGSPPLDQELCHTSATCPSGKTCVSALGNDNDLPRALSICK